MVMIVKSAYFDLAYLVPIDPGPKDTIWGQPGDGEAAVRTDDRMEGYGQEEVLCDRSRVIYVCEEFDLPLQPHQDAALHAGAEERLLWDC